MSSFGKRQFLKAQAARAIALATDARADQRADTIVALGSSATRYEGRTPVVIDGRLTSTMREMRTVTSSRTGSTIRAGKKNQLRFVPKRYDADAPKRGGAHLAAGQRLVDEAGRNVGADGAAGAAYVARTAYVEHEAAWDPETTPAMREALRSTAAVRIGGNVETTRVIGRPVTVIECREVKGADDTDPGEDEKSLAARLYWERDADGAVHGFGRRRAD